MQTIVSRFGRGVNFVRFGIKSSIIEASEDKHAQLRYTLARISRNRSWWYYTFENAADEFHHHATRQSSLSRPRLQYPTLSRPINSPPTAHFVVNEDVDRRHGLSCCLIVLMMYEVLTTRCFIPHILQSQLALAPSLVYSRLHRLGENIMRPTFDSVISQIFRSHQRAFVKVWSLVVRDHFYNLFGS